MFSKLNVLVALDVSGAFNGLVLVPFIILNEDAALPLFNSRPVAMFIVIGRDAVFPRYSVKVVNRVCLLPSTAGVAFRVEVA